MHCNAQSPFLVSSLVAVSGHLLVCFLFFLARYRFGQSTAEGAAQGGRWRASIIAAQRARRMACTCSSCCCYCRHCYRESTAPRIVFIPPGRIVAAQPCDAVTHLRETPGGLHGGRNSPWRKGLKIAGSLLRNTRFCLDSLPSAAYFLARSHLVGEAHSLTDVAAPRDGGICGQLGSDGASRLTDAAA